MPKFRHNCTTFQIIPKQVKRWSCMDFLLGSYRLQSTCTLSPYPINLTLNVYDLYNSHLSIYFPAHSCTAVLNLCEAPMRCPIAALHNIGIACFVALGMFTRMTSYSSNSPWKRTCNKHWL